MPSGRKVGEPLPRPQRHGRDHRARLCRPAAGAGALGQRPCGDRHRHRCRQVAALREGRTYIHHLPAESFREPIARGRFLPSTDFAELARPDATLVCVPTPLTAHREPDLTYVENTARAIAPHIRPGQLVVLESTTYPGTTRDVVKPILESSGLNLRQALWLDTIQ